MSILFLWLSETFRRDGNWVEFFTFACVILEFELNCLFVARVSFRYCLKNVSIFAVFPEAMNLLCGIPYQEGGSETRLWSLFTGSLYLSFKRLSLIILCGKFLKQENTHSKCLNLIISPNFISSLKLALPLINFHESSFFHV